MQVNISTRSLLQVLVFLSPLFIEAQFIYPASDDKIFPWFYSFMPSQQNLVENQVCEIEEWIEVVDTNTNNLMDSGYLFFRYRFTKSGLLESVQNDYQINLSYCFSLKQKLGWSDARLERDFTFYTYDSIGRLRKRTDQLTRNWKKARQEKRVVYFQYDSLSRLSQERVLSDSYYFRDKENTDTIFLERESITFQFTYPSDSTIFIICDNPNPMDKRDIELANGFTYQGSLKDYFLEAGYWESSVDDSLNKFVLTIHYARRLHVFGGDCEYPESPYDKLEHYYYNDRREISRIETRYRSGELLKFSDFHFDIDGLVQKQTFSDSQTVTFYRYKKFSEN